MVSDPQSFDANPDHSLRNLSQVLASGSGFRMQIRVHKDLDTQHCPDSSVADRDPN